MRDWRQRIVGSWVARTFGVAVSQNLKERATRVVEEAIELAQAEGVDYRVIEDLLNHVWRKTPGHPLQEVGGIGVTLLAYCEAKGISAETQEMNEVERVLSLPRSYFETRQNIKAAKNVAMQSQGNS